LIFIANVIGYFYVTEMSPSYRISELPPPNFTTFSMLPNESYDSTVCQIHFHGISLLDAIGFALGPYDVDRNPAVFESQMQYFFGANWSELFDYNVHYVGESDPFVVYHLRNNLTVFGFRGFASGAESALQIEFVVVAFLFPYIRDLIPFFTVITEYLMKATFRAIQSFATSFVNPRMMGYEILDVFSDVVDSMPTPRNIVFTGVDVGGIFAKYMGMKYQTHGVSFVSFPIFDPVLASVFKLDEYRAVFVTNVHTFRGILTKQEPQRATNFGIPWIGTSLVDTVESGADVNKGIKVTTSFRDSVYRSFCILSEVCGRGKQFGSYCEALIGARNLAWIREELSGIYT
jgi:hypothetical protein